MTAIQNFFQNLLYQIPKIGISDIIDILVVSFLIYTVLRLVRSSSAARVAWTVLVLLIATWLTSVFDLYACNWILNKILELGFISLVVIFQPEIRRAMERFIATDLPQIRAPGSSADKLLHGDYVQSYFVSQSLDDDVREYDRLVAKEWDRVTRGEADDPAVVATVFLFIATGFAAKASMLLREAKEVVRSYRVSGFDSAAVLAFINTHAPEATREDLQRFWLNDLMNEAEEGLADLDPNWPDAYMERALEYLRSSCIASWKKKSR